MKHSIGPLGKLERFWKKNKNRSFYFQPSPNQFKGWADTAVSSPVSSRAPRSIPTSIVGFQARAQARSVSTRDSGFAFLFLSHSLPTISISLHFYFFALLSSDPSNSSPGSKKMLIHSIAMRCRKKIRTVAQRSAKEEFWDQEGQSY